MLFTPLLCWILTSKLDRLSQQRQESQLYVLFISVSKSEDLANDVMPHVMVVLQLNHVASHNKPCVDVSTINIGLQKSYIHFLLEMPSLFSNFPAPLQKENHGLDVRDVPKDFPLGGGEGAS